MIVGVQSETWVKRIVIGLNSKWMGWGVYVYTKSFEKD
jgi:hypothetical protein